MAYSNALLAQFKQVPDFREDFNARERTDTCFKNDSHANSYPIVSLGTYSADQIALKSKSYAGLRAIIFNIGVCFLLYGLVKSSPDALTIGLLSLAFACKNIAENWIVVTICPAVLIGLRRQHPIYSKMGPLLNYYAERQQGHAVVTGLYKDNTVTGSTVTNITLLKNGESYDAYFIQRHQEINAWVLHAMEGHDFPGMSLVNFSKEYHALLGGHKFNHVIVSGPSVGHSSGWPNSENIGDGFSAALKLLETIKATHIIMKGHGMFGGFSLAKAIETHDFTSENLKSIRYLVLSLSSASSLEEAMRYSRMGKLGVAIVNLAGMNFSTNKMLEKLEHLKIKHLVIGHKNSSSPSDGVVSDEASLIKRLKNHRLNNVELITVEEKLFETPLYKVRDKRIKEVLINFLKNHS